MWNASIFGQFEKERKKPVLDLIRQIQEEPFERIIDVGCGTGNSTLPLLQQFPNSQIIGVDQSENMLMEARKQSEQIQWLLRDGSQSLRDLGSFDLVFSNAFMPWIPDQEAFIRNSRFLLNKGGIFAAQIPDFASMKIVALIEEVVEEMDPTGSIFAGVDAHTAYNTDVQEYYNATSRYFPELEVWETSYYHQMNDATEIVEFMAGAYLTPYLAILEEDLQKEFLERIQIKTVKAYGGSENGLVLFEIKRIFILARK